MTQFTFYGSHEDWWLYLDALSHAREYTFVVDMWYKDEIPLEFKYLTEEIRGVLIENPILYLFSPLYSRFPPKLELIAESMRLSPLCSGPALHLSLPPCKQQSGVWHLGLGFVSYQREYMNPHDGTPYSPPSNLRENYAQVRKTLQKLMVKRYAPMTQQVYEKKPEVKTVWIGPNAIEKLESGQAQIRIYTDWWKGSELRKTKE